MKIAPIRYPRVLLATVAVLMLMLAPTVTLAAMKVYERASFLNTMYSCSAKVSVQYDGVLHEVSTDPFTFEFQYDSWGSLDGSASGTQEGGELWNLGQNAKCIWGANLDFESMNFYGSAKLSLANVAACSGSIGFDMPTTLNVTVTRGSNPNTNGIPDIVNLPNRIVTRVSKVESFSFTGSRMDNLYNPGAPLVVTGDCERQ